MGCLGGPLAFRPGLLRPPGTFTVGLEGYFLGQLPQRGDHLRGPHAAEDAPLVLWDRNHHAVIGLGDVVRDIVEREFLVNALSATPPAPPPACCRRRGPDKNRTRRPWDSPTY